MKVEKFYEYYKDINNMSDTKINVIQKLVNGVDKGFEFKFASSSVFCFGKDKEEISILLFDEDIHLDIQNKLGKKVKSIGGYNIYRIDKILKNPFFNNNNQYLESHFYFLDNDYFKKIKYFISKIMSISEELNHYPSINWDSNRIVEIRIYTHKTGGLTEKDFILSERISDVWYNIII
jgi:pterin-4a-carbinolamine dehydratase